MLQYPAVDLLTGRAAQEGSDAEWAAVLTEIADAGFDHVEIADSWLRVGDLAPDRLAALGAVAAAAGLSVPTVNVARRSVIDADHGAQNLAYDHRTIDAAATLGASVLCTSLHQPLTDDQRGRLWFWTGQGHVDPDDPEVRGLAVRRFRELGRHAAEVGMALSLELYEDTYLGTSESAVRLVEEIGLPNVGLNPDIGNLVRLHRPVEDWWDIATRTLPYANYWHVKSYQRDEDPVSGRVTAVPAPLESGFVDYRRVVRLAVSVGFQGVICCEHYGGDGLSVSAANRDYLRRVLPRPDRPVAVGESRVQQVGLRHAG